MRCRRRQPSSVLAQLERVRRLSSPGGCRIRASRAYYLALTRLVQKVIDDVLLAGGEVCSAAGKSTLSARHVAAGVHLAMKNAREISQHMSVKSTQAVERYAASVKKQRELAKKN